MRKLWEILKLDLFYGAPTVIVVFSDTRLTNNAFQDRSLVLGNLMNAAFSLGVDSCWINRATETFKTPAGIELMKSGGLMKIILVSETVYWVTEIVNSPKPNRAKTDI